MGLTGSEENFIKDLYQETLKNNQKKILREQLWFDVEVLKESTDPMKWKLIQDRKQEYRDAVAAL
jgi:hypothetical protein